MRVASGAAGDGGAAGGVIGVGALGLVRPVARVPQVMDRLTLMMAIVSRRW